MVTQQKTVYVCTKCKAEDSDPGVNPPAPLVLTCAACGAGRNMTIQEMLQSGQGMFPVKNR